MRATALEMFAAEAIDLVLLGYAMPDVNGGMILREIKVGAGISPVIMVSASPLDRDEVDCADCLITKGQGHSKMCRNTIRSWLRLELGQNAQACI